MQMGKSQGAQKPTAMGSLLQASTYGSTIPVIYGMTMSPLLAIWAANLRASATSSLKKLKAAKKGVSDYVENIDFLLGHNPIRGVFQFWVNGAPWPLTFTKQVFTLNFEGSPQLTITDPHFMAVVAVTVTVPYSQTFNDYGSSAGPQTVAGTMEMPLWNVLEVGPDPTNPNSYRNFPYTYRWQPSYGANVYVDELPLHSVAGMPFAVNVYYAQLMKATSYLPPAQKLRLSFEAELGSGDEYDGYSSQQITYPHFAGLGSPNIDMGAGGAIPQLQAEVAGKWGIYPTGDGDFVDMIEDIFKSGVSQAAVSSSVAYTQFEHGLSSYSMPGTVQKKYTYRYEYGSTAIPFDLPNTAGNPLVAFIDSDSAGPMTVTDTAGNIWIQAATRSRTNAGPYTFALYYCAACVGGANTVNFGGGGFYGIEMIILELAGVDTFDAVAVAVGANASASLVTTNQQGFPELMLAFSMQENTSAGNVVAGQTNLWPLSIPPFGAGGQPFLQQRNVTNPGTYPLAWGSGLGGAPGPDSYMVMIGFKATQPASYPAPVGDFLDLPSLDLTRRQCRANGLVGSLTMTSQQAASEWLKSLYSAANAAPVFMGFKLYSFPYSEVSYVGNGAVYVAPTAAGPVASLSADNGDFIPGKGRSPITINRQARVNLPNVLQMQCISRSSNYQQVTVAQPEAASIALYGVRKADPVVNNAIQDASIALQLLAIQARRNVYAPYTFSFTVNAKWGLLAPMDLVLITDRLANINAVPVRLTSTTDNNGEIECEAEPFLYGMCAPILPNTSALVVTTPVPYQPNPTADPGAINTPIIFEPVPRLYGGGATPELWLVVSAPGSGFGGSQVFVSTDGGNSYNPAGGTQGNPATGVTTADWAAAADPDAVDNLELDLTESSGTLLSYMVADENNFAYPCYVAGGGSSAIPYELMTYAIATLTAANKYRLLATGAGNQLRRAVFGAPAAGAGCDHPSGSRFAFLSPAGEGILKLTMDPKWIGVTLYFKFIPVNSFGVSTLSLGAATAYTYTPSGGPASPSSPNATNYTQSPTIALAQPTATSITSVVTSEAFATSTLVYNPRTFTIPAPTVPTWYYVTVADPGYVGDTGGLPTLAATCASSNSLVGVSGNVYLGAILAIPGGGATRMLSGGWPAPATFQVGT
jgi:hypothetical protein